MRRRPMAAACLCVVMGLLLAAADSEGQGVMRREFAANVIVPQSRSFAIRGQEVVRITQVEVGVRILEQTATTTMDIHLANPSGRLLEAELIVPVPAGAVVRGFDFEGKGSEPSAVLLPKDEARATYNSIVAKVRDPALLEFLGCNLIRSSVFPVPANGTQKLRLIYEELLAADGDRIDYVLPRTESIDYMVPWEVAVGIESKRPISTLYSPSHKIETVRGGRGQLKASIAKDATLQPGPFRLSFLVEHNGVTASLLAYPDMKVNGGYFLLFAGLPAELPKDEHGEPAIKREVTLVLDRSGSMNGEKIEQVREASLQVLGGLAPGEAFNIIVYNEAVECFSSQPVPKTDETVKAAREYLKGIRSSGGTNIHDALLEALRQKPVGGMLPMVLFLTDGLPTVGQTSEVAIRNVAIKANPYNRRIFTFGVGVDVNTPLLDRIAEETRACATYVLPKEDVEVKVGRAFKRLSGPVLADAVLSVETPDGRPAMGAVQEVLPARLPDLFEGDQLVLLGKYVGDSPNLTFVVSGNYLGRKRTFLFTFTFDKATVQNAFVPRLWASRKIAVLVEAIRQLGAESATGPATVDVRTDPRVKELVDAIVKLSTEYGILTEYTAFLAREGTNLSDKPQVLAEALRNFDARALRVRSGWGSVNQSLNNEYQRNQVAANPRNRFYDAQMNEVQSAAVQQVNDRTFYRRGDRWVDGRILAEGGEAKVDREISIGSKEFLELAERLAAEGRAGSVSMKGEMMLEVDGKTVLVK